MGCQNNTAVAVSRFKPIQCIACRFLRWLYVSHVDPLLSWVSFGKSDFQEKHFYNQLYAIPIVNWFLKVLSMPIPLYSMWQVYQTCSLLRLLRHRRAVKRRRRKRKAVLILYACLYLYLQFLFHQHQCIFKQKLMFPNIFPFSVSHSEKKKKRKRKKKKKKKPRHMRLKDTLSS